MDEPHVIDLTEGRGARVRFVNDGDPFAGLDPAARTRLLVRILCELVAYGEVDQPADLGVTVDLAVPPA